MVARPRREDPAAHGRAVPARCRAARRRLDEHRARPRPGEGRVDLSLAEVAPEGWNAALDEAGVADVYFTREYVEAAALLEAGSPLFLRNESAVFAGIRRTDPYDVVTPYGYGGPVGTPFWDDYDEWCRTNGIVTTFVRFHPLYANYKDAAPFVHIERLAGTVAWRLDQEDLFAGMHRHHRRIVRKAGAIDTTVTRGPSTLDGFVPRYERTMDRKDASDFYYFSPEYWHALAELGDRIVLFEAGDYAALLCFATPPWLHYHLGATSDEGRKRGVSNLLFYEAARWAAAEGFTHFHLGGGLGGGEDSLFEFKLRFDPGGLLEMALGKVIHDEDTYRALGGTGTDGFFPAYRRAASTVRA